MGLLDFPTYLYDLLANLDILWGVLNSPMLGSLDRLIDYIISLGSMETGPTLSFLYFVRFILSSFGVSSSVTVLGFIFSIMGSLFMFYLGFQLIKWVIDILP